MPLNTTLPNIPEDIRKLVDEGRALPPVELWHPTREGVVAIRIARDGQWFFQDEPMTREATVHLFSTILRKDGEDYFLVTPAEKQKIEVEDVPFVVRLMDVENPGTSAQKIHFATNVGDHFTLSLAHPLMFEQDKNGAPLPYVLVRSTLRARLLTTVYYSLAELAVENGLAEFGIWSDGCFFLLEG